MAGFIDNLRASWALRAGQRALAEGDTEEASRLCGDAVERSPEWIPASLWAAVAASESGDVDRALELLGAAADRWPKRAVVHLFRGRALLDCSREEEALDALEAARELDPANLQVGVYLALVRWCLEPSFEHVPPSGPRSVAGGAPLWGRWLLAVEERFPGGAGNDFGFSSAAPSSTGERLAHWRAKRHLDAAQGHVDAGNLGRAKASLERAEILWPGDLELEERRVLVHKKSADALATAIEADPGDVDLRLEAAEDHLVIGENREAQQILAPVTELVESIDANRLSWRTDAALLSGRAALALADLATAEELLAEARTLAPLEVEPAYYWGVASLRVGNRSAARGAFIDACSFDPQLAWFRLKEHRAAVEGEAGA